MLIVPKKVCMEQETLRVHAPQAAGMISKWLASDGESPELSLRWALARTGNEAAIVIGVRHQGRGFDLLLKKSDWEYLLQQPERLQIDFQEEGHDPNASISVEIPAGSFDEFIDSCQKEFAADPGKTVMGEVVSYFA
jgi:hypothetical protein